MYYQFLQKPNTNIRDYGFTQHTFKIIKECNGIYFLFVISKDNGKAYTRESLFTSTVNKM